MTKTNAHTQNLPYILSICKIMRLNLILPHITIKIKILSSIVERPTYNLLEFIVDNGDALECRMPHIPLDIAQERGHLVEDLAQRLELVARVLEYSAHDYAQELLAGLRRPVLDLVQQTVEDEDGVAHVLDGEQEHSAQRLLDGLGLVRL